MSLSVRRGEGEKPKNFPSRFNMIRFLFLLKIIAKLLLDLLKNVQSCGIWFKMLEFANKLSFLKFLNACIYLKHIY